MKHHTPHGTSTALHTTLTAATPSAQPPIDFRSVDKSHFKCFEMDDGTVYYGEVGYFMRENPDQFYAHIEDVPSGSPEDPVEVKERLVRPIRHGYGIQLYGRNPEAGDKLCYYSGRWYRDQKHGDGGILIYPDGVSKYIGSFKNNQYNGSGTLHLKCANKDGTVTSKHVYQGTFKEGKLEGSGTFENGLTKQQFGPEFRNNHFLMTAPVDPLEQRRAKSPTSPRSLKTQHITAEPPKILVDLFGLENTQSKDQYVNSVCKYRANAAREQREHDDRVRVYRIKNDLQQELHDALDQTKAENRTAIILTSVESKLTFDVLDQVLSQNEKLHLRDYELSWRRSLEDRDNITGYYKQVLRQQLTQGGKMVLLVDEMPTPERNVEWREMYDPDITHLINSHVNPLPLHLWRPQDFRGSLEILVRLVVVSAEGAGSISDEERQALLEDQASQLAWDGFNFILWSKTKLSEDQAHAAGKRAAAKIHVDGEAKEHVTENAINEELVKGLKKRFEKSLPLQCLNLIFVESPAAAAFLASYGGQGGDTSLQME